jgi:hypothetical protein
MSLQVFRRSQIGVMVNGRRKSTFQRMSAGYSAPTYCPLDIGSRIKTISATGDWRRNRQLQDP